MNDTSDQSEPTAQEIAEETSHRVQPDDPYTEPPDSTVDDWLGQRVDAEMESLEDAPGSGVDDDESSQVPEPNEPA